MARFHLDHNVSQKIAPLLQVAGHDVVTARGLGMETAGDDAHLLAAAKDQRILITYNVKDFRLLHDAWLRWSREWGVTQAHAGILIVPDDWPAPLAAQRLDVFVQRGAINN